MCGKSLLKMMSLLNKASLLGISLVLVASPARAEDFSFQTPAFPGATAKAGGVEVGGVSRSHGDAASSSAYGSVPGSDEATAAAAAGNRSAQQGNFASSDSMLGAEAWSKGAGSPTSQGAGSPTSRGAGNPTSQGTSPSDIAPDGNSNDGDAFIGGHYATIVDPNGNPVRVKISADGSKVMFDNGYIASAGGAGGNVLIVDTGVSGIGDLPASASVDVKRMQIQGLTKSMISLLHNLLPDQMNSSKVTSILSSADGIDITTAMLKDLYYSQELNALVASHQDVLVKLRLAQQYFDAKAAVDNASAGDNGVASADQEARLRQLSELYLPALSDNERIIREYARIAKLDVAYEFALFDAQMLSAQIGSSASNFAGNRVPSPPQPVVTVDPDTGATSTYIPPYAVSRIDLDQQEIALKMMALGIEVQKHMSKGNLTLPMILDQIKQEASNMYLLSVSANVTTLSSKQETLVLTVKSHVEQGAAMTQAEYGSLAADIKAQMLAAGLDSEQEASDYSASGGVSNNGANECNALTAIWKPSLCLTGGLF